MATYKDFKLVCNHSIIRMLFVLLIHAICCGFASASIVKQINVTESESYGNWTYTTI